jgi:hypothetical protein
MISTDIQLVKVRTFVQLQAGPASRQQIAYHIRKNILDLWKSAKEQSKLVLEWTRST